MLIENLKKAVYETPIIVIGDLEVIMSVMPYFNEIEYKVYIEKEIVKDELYDLKDVFDYINSLDDEEVNVKKLFNNYFNGALDEDNYEEESFDDRSPVIEDYLNGDLYLIDLLELKHFGIIDYLVKNYLVREDDKIKVNIVYISNNLGTENVYYIMTTNQVKRELSEKILTSFDTLKDATECVVKNKGLIYNTFIKRYITQD